MGISRWFHRRRISSEQDIANARESLREAKQEHAKQVRLRDQEREAVVNRIERLAQNNHLGALIWDTITNGNGD